MKRLIRQSITIEKTKFTHDISTRDKAIVYKNGQFFEGWMHEDCEEDMQNHQVYHEQEKELAFAHMVNEAKDGTGNKKCIYIMTKKYGIVGNIFEIAKKFKKQYPDYDIYDDDTGKFNFSTMKVEYDKLAKKINKLIRKSSMDIESNMGLYNEKQIKEIENAESQGIDILKYINPSMSELDIKFRAFAIKTYINKISPIFSMCNGIGNLTNEQFRNIVVKMNTLYDLIVSNNLKITKEDLDFSTNTNDKYEKLMDKFIRVERFDSLPELDMNRRNKALVYIDGMFIEGLSHRQCFQYFLDKIKSDKKLKETYRINERPDVSEIFEIIGDDGVLFLGHIIDNLKTLTHNPNVRPNEKAVFLIKPDIWYKNITKKEAAKVIRESGQYDGYKVYLDEEWKINADDWYRDYKEAKLKQHLHRMKRLIKKANDERVERLLASRKNQSKPLDYFKLYVMSGINKQLTDEEIEFVLDHASYNGIIADRILTILGLKKANISQIQEKLNQISNDKSYYRTSFLLKAIGDYGVDSKKINLMLDESICVDKISTECVFYLLDLIEDTEVEELKSIILLTRQAKIKWDYICEIIEKLSKNNVLVSFYPYLKMYDKINLNALELAVDATIKGIDLEEYKKYKNEDFDKAMVLNKLLSQKQNKEYKTYFEFCLQNIKIFSAKRLEAICFAIKRNITFHEFRKYMKFLPDEVTYMNELKQSIIEENSQEALETFNEMTDEKDEESKKKAKEYRKNQMGWIRFLDKMRD